MRKNISNGNYKEFFNAVATERSKVSLSFHNIHYEINHKLYDIPCAKSEKREILCGLSAQLPPGLNAIMGPTGSGKTSLLDVLAQRKDPKGLTDGMILMNGERPPDDFRLMSGYVVQDDVVMGTLTVRENIAFSANLRLSNELYDEEARKKKVEEVIVQLGLEACADTKVGNEFIRGVSGGERKRVNIGMEMVLDPPILFLDEPTTGLDANTANSIVLLLYKLASNGRNIIISIHQPRYSIFSLFDQLIILNEGKMVYRGLAKSSVKFFEEIGFPCPRFHNPADFFLDVIGGDVNTAQLLARMRKNSVKINDDESATSSSQESSSYALEERKNRLHDAFVKHPDIQEEENKLLEIQRNYEMKHRIGGEYNEQLFQPQYANGVFVQLRGLLYRTALNNVRDPMVFYGQTIIMLIFGTLVGLIYFQTDTSYSTGLQNRSGCFFFLITTQIMSNLSALQLFIQNRKNYIHETSGGYYRTSAYFISQVFADLIPNRLIPNTVFCTLTYFMIGLRMEADKFFIFMLVLDLSAITACSLSFLVSASVRIFAVANVIVSLPTILMMLFGGFLANTLSLLDWLEWIKYISLFRYGINAITVNEMTGLVFIDNTSYPGFDPSSSNPCISTITNSTIPRCKTGEAYMREQGIPYGVWELWENIVILGAMGVGVLILAYVQLRRVNLFK